MAEITLIVDPGADDIIIDGISLNDIDAFRDECLTAGDVSCDWDTLHNRLISHDISRFWWFLTEAERRSIAEHAIKNTIFYQIYFTRHGKPNCEGGEGEWGTTQCSTNTGIRYLRFASIPSTQFSDPTTCYWRRYNFSDEVCFVPEYSYGLPCNGIHRVGHSMCGIHVRPGIDDLNNWIVFQYSDFDIKPGDEQLPYGVVVVVQIVKDVQKGGCINKTLAEFEV